MFIVYYGPKDTVITTRKREAGMRAQWFDNGSHNAADYERYEFAKEAEALLVSGDNCWIIPCFPHKEE